MVCGAHIFEIRNCTRLSIISVLGNISLLQSTYNKNVHSHINLSGHWKIYFSCEILDRNPLNKSLSVTRRLFLKLKVVYFALNCGGKGNLKKPRLIKLKLFTCLDIDIIRMDCPFGVDSCSTQRVSVEGAIREFGVYLFELRVKNVSCCQRDV